MKIAMICASTAIACLLGLSMPVAAKKDKQDKPDVPAQICQSGQLVCRGTYGSRCFTSSQGETCINGYVCSAGESACLGRLGRSCYQPSRGQSCTQGLICGTSEYACVRGERAYCYTPSRGETCN